MGTMSQPYALLPPSLLVPRGRLRAEAIRQQQLDPLIRQVLPQAGLCTQDVRGPDTPLRFVQLSPRGWTCLCLGRVAVISRQRIRQITWRNQFTECAKETR